MSAYKSFALAGCLLAAAVVSACSGDKVLPKGERVSVLAPAASIKPDTADGAARIKVPQGEMLTGWLQNDVNAQHVIPNITAGTAFVKQWSERFGKGSSKRDFLISKPLIDGDTVYTLDARGELRALALADGKLKWRLALQPKNKYMQDTALKGVGIAMDNGILFAATGYGDVYAVDAQKGTVIWSKALHLPLRIAPVTAAGKIFVQSADNKFFALDMKNGEEVWTYDISLENTTMVGGSPAAYSKALDVIITGFSNGEIQAFNATLGTPLWSDVLVSNRLAYSSTFLNTVKAAPVVENGVVYALGNANVLAAVDIRSGMRLWEKEIGGINTPLSAGNVLYVVTNTNDLVAVAKDSGDILWAVPVNLGGKAGDVTVYAPIMINGRLVVALSNGKVHTFIPQTGKLMKTIDLDEELNSAPIAAGGYVVFVTSDADLIAYK